MCRCSIALSVLVVVALPATFVQAQSLNIDFGQPSDAPAATYAAAGLPGVWNSIPAANETYTHNLLALDGQPTAVRLYQYGGTQLISADDPQTAGDDGTLMDDCLVTYDSALESCLFIRFLEIARYEIVVYARMPNRPDVLSYASCDEEPGYPHVAVGGEWPGGHAEGVTFSRHFAVPDPVLTRLQIHSGIVPGANARDGAALNGVQLVKVRPGDVTANGTVDINDLLEVITSWGACPGPAQTCAADTAPYPGGNGAVDVDDMIAVIANWG